MRTLPQTLQNFAVTALAVLLINQTVSAQDALTHPATLLTQAAIVPAFQAVVFPAQDPLVLKVIVENPAKESLTFRLRNEHGEVVYQKPLGKVSSYNSRVYLSEVIDGSYTLEIAGQSVRYARPFRVGTRVARLAEVR